MGVKLPEFSFNALNVSVPGVLEKSVGWRVFRRFPLRASWMSFGVFWNRSGGRRSSSLFLRYSS